MSIIRLCHHIAIRISHCFQQMRSCIAGRPCSGHFIKCHFRFLSFHTFHPCFEVVNAFQFCCYSILGSHDAIFGSHRINHRFSKILSNPIGWSNCCFIGNSDCRNQCRQLFIRDRIRYHKRDIGTIHNWFGDYQIRIECEGCNFRFRTLVGSQFRSCKVYLHINCCALLGCFHIDNHFEFFANDRTAHHHVAIADYRQGQLLFAIKLTSLIALYFCITFVYGNVSERHRTEAEVLQFHLDLVVSNLCHIHFLGKISTYFGTIQVYVQCSFVYTVKFCSDRFHLIVITTSGKQSQHAEHAEQIH